MGAVLAQAAAGVAGALVVAPPSTWPRLATAAPEPHVAQPLPAAPASVDQLLPSPGASAVRLLAARKTTRNQRAGTAPGTAATSPAARVVLSPPFSEGSRVTGCFPAGPQCRVESVSRPEDGYSSALVAFTSPGNGTAPGVGSAQGYAGVVAELRLAAPAHRAVITAVVDVTRADVGHEVGPLGVPALRSRAELALQEVAIHSVCGGWGCFGTSVKQLARMDDSEGLKTGSAPSGQRRLQVVLANPSGLMPAGTIWVSVELYARAELGNMSPSGASPDVGTVHAAGALHVVEVETAVT